MANTKHSQHTITDGIHIINAYEFVNEAARNAFSATPSDIGKAARQLDTGDFYLLLDDSPLTWEQLNGIEGTDEFVKVSANDTTPGYLNGKLLSGNSIEFTELGDGGNENLRIAVANNGIDTAQLNNNAVIASKLAINSVENQKIQNLAVSTGKIENLAVTEAKIADNAVTEAKIADAAVTLFQSYPPGFIDGLVAEFNSVSTVDISVGSCRSNGNGLNIDVASPLTANIAVSGANGRDGGSELASTWYYLYVIADSAAVNPVASLLSTNPTTPSLPSGYTDFRRVGEIFNNGSSDFRPFKSIQDNGRRRVVHWNDLAPSTYTVLSSGNATSFTDVSMANFVPASSERAIFSASFVSGGSGTTASFRTDGDTETDPQYKILVSAGDSSQQVFYDVPTLSRVIEYAVDNADSTVDIFMIGYITFV